MQLKEKESWDHINLGKWMVINRLRQQLQGSMSEMGTYCVCKEDKSCRLSLSHKNCSTNEEVVVDARIAQNQFWVCLMSLNNTERMRWKHLTVSQGRLQRTWGLWRTITTVSVNAPFNLWCFVSKCGFWVQDTPLDLVVVSVSEVLSGSCWACRQRG